MADTRTGLSSDVLERTKVKRPGRYKVILLNDDYTTMDFVVMILEEIFNKSEQDANVIMMAVHKIGKAVAGVFSLEIAQTKVSEVHQMARDNGFPLRCEIEAE